MGIGADIPDRGDVIWLTFDPVVGHEQGGRRPALVLSRKLLHRHSGLVVVCPITSKSKKYPFEVAFQGKRIKGYILTDQIRSCAWKNRRARFIERLPEEDVEEVLEKVSVLFR